MAAVRFLKASQKIDTYLSDDFILEDKKDDNFSLGESGSIYIYEFGFGMLKNDTYLWNYKKRIYI